MLFNIFERKFILFGQVFWPQDFFLLALTLVTLFVFVILFTVAFGRIWCGWACPQTLFMEMVFRKIEFLIEGDANEQRRINNGPWNAKKIRRKVTKQIIFIALSVLIAHITMAYLISIEEVKVIISQSPSEHMAGFIGLMVFTGIFYGVFAYFREQACIAVCPYGRLQGVLLVKDSIVVAYDYKRGEPRGTFFKGENRAEAGKGDCIHCTQCVQVCPTGIDIRQGLQYECIGCAACVDGCDQVMDKMGYPKGLIRYVSENGLEGHFDRAAMMKRVTRPRVLIYTAILIAIIIAAGLSLASRNPLKVDVLRDRGALAREAAPGVIENVYRVQIMNTDETPRRFTIEAAGLPGIKVVGVEQPVAVEAAGSKLLPLRLTVAAESAPPGTHKVELRVRAVEDANVSRDEHTTFILPKP